MRTFVAEMLCDITPHSITEIDHGKYGITIFLICCFLANEPFLWSEGFKDLLAGSEYTQILAVVANQIGTLRIVDNLQKEYLEATKNYKQNPNDSLMRERRQKWFDDVSMLTEQSVLVLHITFFYFS